MIRHMVPSLLAAALLTVPVSGQERKWVQLFNGRDLTGWTPKITGSALGDNYGNTFRVENGLLKVVYDKDKYPKWAGQFGHLFYNVPFSRYIIAVEYRFVGEQVTGGPAWATRNSGIMIHCQKPETMGKDQDFPISIEVQLLGGNGKDPRPTANLCTPGTNVVMDGKLFTAHCKNSTSETFHGEQWVRVEAEVDGAGVIKHRVNGVEVLHYEQAQVGGGSVTNFDPAAKPDGKLLTEGWISLQSESHPVEFRKVEIIDLSKK
jgi:hypothetical protein